MSATRSSIPGFASLADVVESESQSEKERPPATPAPRRSVFVRDPKGTPRDGATVSRPAARVARALLRDNGGRFGLAVVGLLCALALLAPQIAPRDPFVIGADPPLAPPVGANPFGTDELGRDVLSRTIFGARISLSVAFGSAAAALLVAVPLGLLAGYVGGHVDTLISRFPPFSSGSAWSPSSAPGSRTWSWRSRSSASRRWAA